MATLLLRRVAFSLPQVAGHCQRLKGVRPRPPSFQPGGLQSLPAPGACRSFSSSSSEKDPYRTLGVDRNASDEEIKKAYRKQAMKWHPDRQPPEKREEAQQKFSEAANAYEILSDPQKRRQYDAGGGMGSMGGMGSEKDPYRTLGVDRNASDEEIKKAYRKQAMKWHPDRQPPEKREEAQQKFSEAANAYEILSDPQKRRQYDAGGGMGSMGGMGSGPGHGFHPGQGFQGGGFHHSPESAERLFREVFGSGAFEQMLGQFFGQQAGNSGGPAQLRVGMEVTVLRDFGQVLAACRRSGIDSTNDAKRRQALGKKGRIIKVDPEDHSVKLQIAGVGDVWFGAGAVQPIGQAGGFPGGFPGFHFGAPGGGGAGGLQEIRQEMVTTPDGRRVLRITRRVRQADGSMREEVTEAPLQ
eukprot:TRINITY_DN26832_c0_g1_i1.p1 TRINITY_DN26832_c0_g1~~TRINITY_DN26832_c0_g1_i1.p1  ORF type:complete len:412 (-),score=103.61 TRINITY_DN26832_c0_g1_i1:193-1428(-)